MSNEDNSRYALLTSIRRRANFPWKEKLGDTYYFARRTENLIQISIPFSNDFLMLVYFNAKINNYDEIIMRKIMPMILPLASQKNNNIKRTKQTRH